LFHLIISATGLLACIGFGDMGYFFFRCHRAKIYTFTRKVWRVMPHMLDAYH
jgi:hypothetical protein